MTRHTPFPDLPPDPPRGAAPVGQLTELPPLELLAIVYLRSWCEGGETRARIAEDFTLLLGADQGEVARADFEALMRVMLEGARRPLMRHAVPCRCFGGDESAFANLIAAAATGAREEAMLFASVLMSGPAAFAALRLAEDLGPAFLRMARGAARAARAERQPTHGGSDTGRPN